MAFDPATIWETRTTGSDSNGGGFNAASSGTDYSNQDSPQVTYTDLVIDAATNTNCTSAANPFTSLHVGNVINVTSGTGFTVQRVQVVSVAAGVATCDKSLGTLGSTGGNGKLGGALATLSTAIALPVAGNTIYLKATATYTLTSTVTIAVSGNTTNGRIRIEGYTTTRGARDGRPLVTTSTNSVNLFTFNAGGTNFAIVHVQGTNTAGTRGAFLIGAGASASTNFIIEDCLVDGCTYLSNGGTRAIAGLYVLRTTVRNCTVGVILNPSGAGADVIDGCLFYGNTGAIYSAGNATQTLITSDTVYSGGTFAITDANSGSARNMIVSVVGCSFRGQSGNAINQANAASTWTVYANRNNVFWSIGGYCWGLQSANQGGLLARSETGASNFYGSATSGYQQGYSNGANLVTLTADPFTNAASGDFSLNTAAGGGAAVRGAGFPGAYPGGTTTGYADGGSVQHQDSGGSAPANPLSLIITPAVAY